MAKNTTRHRIRGQAFMAAENVGKAIRNLKRIEEMADERSKVINENLPNLVLMVDTTQKALEMFRASL